jgi:hypothetical protein
MKTLTHVQHSNYKEIAKVRSLTRFQDITINKSQNSLPPGIMCYIPEVSNLWVKGTITKPTF